MTTTAEQDRALAAGQAVTMAGALNQALSDALSEDDTVLVFGEDVATLGGVFRITSGLAEAFGPVSYTHLDVYKRQRRTCSFCSSRRRMGP